MVNLITAQLNLNSSTVEIRESLNYEYPAQISFQQ